MTATMSMWATPAAGQSLAALLGAVTQASTEAALRLVDTVRGRVLLDTQRDT